MSNFAVASSVAVMWLNSSVEPAPAMIWSSLLFASIGSVPTGLLPALASQCRSLESFVNCSRTCVSR
jgi:hypothetical protein